VNIENKLSRFFFDVNSRFWNKENKSIGMGGLPHL